MTSPRHPTKPIGTGARDGATAVSVIPSPLALWIYAARVRTLPASVAPVLIGIAIAAGDGAAHAPSALAALLGALLIQIGTNFANDHADFARGVDDASSGGRRRLLPEGVITPRQMLGAAVLSFTLAVVVGLFLVVRGGWPILLIGVASILAGLLYTGGPAPYGYRGLGELFVFVFFGPVAVAGTFYVQALSWDWRPIVAGFGPGFLSVALLAINNLRDLDNDRAKGKRTLAVLLGPTFARREIPAALGLSVLSVVPLIVSGAAGPWLLMTAAILPASVPVVRTVLTSRDATALDASLSKAGRLLVLFTASFCIGWLV